MPPEPGTRARPGAPAGPAPVTPGSVAPVGTRVLAYALDVLVLLAAAVLGAVLAPDVPLVPAVVAALVAVGQWIAEARTGATVGSAVTGIRTVSAATRRPAGLVTVLVRQLVVAAGLLALVVGQWVVVASGAWDRSPAQRGWHDRAAGTVVLRARAVRRGPAGPTPRAAGGAATALVREPPLVAGAAPGRARHADRPPPAPLITQVPGADPGRRLPPAGPVIDTPEPVTAAMPTVEAPRPGLLPGPRPDRAGTPAVRPVDPVLGAVAPTGLRLRFDTGEELDVTGDGLVGRSPTPEAGVVHLVAIDDPDRSISKVHLAFGPDGGGSRLWVRDRGSTNGTVVVGPDGRSAVLRPGDRAVVDAGWTVRFGRRAVVVQAR